MDQNDLLPDRLSISKPTPVDPIILGLERKLDVLRAQLAACRAGEDPGEAGLVTWSRLEDQHQRIQHLMQENATLVQEREAAVDALALRDVNAGGGDAEMNRLRREAAAMRSELERAREEVYIRQQTAIALGRAIVTAPYDNCDVAPQVNTHLWDRRMLEAMQNSTCWRITAPVRVVGELSLIRQIRHAVYRYLESA